MKGDFTRDTFKPARHYQQVLIQQGRAQVDADWNEQAALSARRDETIGSDIVGDCGGPAHSAAFGVITKSANLTAKQLKDLQDRNIPTQLTQGDFFIGTGRYYVDGIQCENELARTYTAQPDRFDVQPLAKNKNYVLYLDVWRRHLTALDDDGIREAALGGPDTGTRVKTVWQLRVLDIGGNVGPNPCDVGVQQLKALMDPDTARLTAETVTPQAPADPCTVPPSAGFTGLENQLYRVEIHDKGEAIDAVNAPGSAAVTLPTGNTPKNQITVGGGAWAKGAAVELYPSKVDAPKMKGQLGWITKVNGNALTLSADVTGFVANDLPRLRPVQATWKWSRDNGSVVAGIDSFVDGGVKLLSLGPDRILGFTEGAWVEILDDKTELEGMPGAILQIAEVVPETRVIRLKADQATLATIAAGITVGRGGKVRRWDGVSAVKLIADPQTNWLQLESGIQVNFAQGLNGGYRTGQWWQIPARAATSKSPNGDIEWPKQGNNRVALPPRGITHHFCRIATVEVDNAFILKVTDCRCLHPTLTSVPRMFYVSGDGQEVMPDLTVPGNFYKLPQPLIVGIANPQCFETPATVQFTIKAGNGKIAGLNGPLGPGPANVPIDAAGLAICYFHLDGVNASQRVEARLLDDSKLVSLPIIFNATLSVASQVAYDPAACAGLKEQKTVQAAIDRVARIAHLALNAGDGQDVDVGEACAKPLQVSVSSICEPLKDIEVAFDADPNGVVAKDKAGLDAPNASSSTKVKTDGQGIATCWWKPAAAPLTQQVKASVSPIPGQQPFESPHTLYFTANVRRAAAGGACCVEIGADDPIGLAKTITNMLDAGKTNICICLLPGEHKLKDRLDIVERAQESTTCVKIEGCSAGCSRLVFDKGPIVAKGLKLFQLSNLTMYSEKTHLLEYDRCADVIIDACRITRHGGGSTAIAIAGAESIRITHNDIIAYAPPKHATGDIRFKTSGEVRTWSTLMDSLDVIAEKLGTLSPQLLEATVTSLVNAFSLPGTTAEARRRGDTVTAAFRVAAPQRGTGAAGPAAVGGRAIVPASGITEQGAKTFRPAVIETTSGTALTIVDAGADTRILDNRIFGGVTLYGATFHHTRADFMKLAADLKTKPPKATSRSAQIRGNTLTNVFVSDSLKAGGATTVFGQIVFADNIVFGSGNQFAAKGVTMASNTVHGASDDDVAVIACLFTTVTGNASDMQTTIKCYVPDPARFLREQGTNITNIPKIVAL